MCTTVENDPIPIWHCQNFLKNPGSRSHNFINSSLYHCRAVLKSHQTVDIFLVMLLTDNTNTNRQTSVFKKLTSLVEVIRTTLSSFCILTFMSIVVFHLVVFLTFVFHDKQVNKIKAVSILVYKSYEVKEIVHARRYLLCLKFTEVCS